MEPRNDSSGDEFIEDVDTMALASSRVESQQSGLEFLESYRVEPDTDAAAQAEALLSDMMARLSTCTTSASGSRRQAVALAGSAAEANLLDQLRAAIEGGGSSVAPQNPEQDQDEETTPLVMIDIKPPMVGLVSTATCGCVVKIGAAVERFAGMVGVVCEDTEAPLVTVEVRAVHGRLVSVTCERQDVEVLQNPQGVPGWELGIDGMCTDANIAQGMCWPYTVCELEKRASMVLSMFGIRGAEAMFLRGLTPHYLLCVACHQTGQEKTAEMLLRDPEVLHRIDEPCDKSVHGLTHAPPLLLAAEKGSLYVLEMLLRAGANVNVRAPDVNDLEHDNFNGGMTPLWKACEVGRLAVVNLLLAWGARTDLGKTLPVNNRPLHIAAQNGHIDSVLALIRASADVNQENLTSGCPHVQALVHGHTEVVAVLLRHGSRVERFVLDSSQLQKQIREPHMHKLLTRGADALKQLAVWSSSVSSLDGLSIEDRVKPESSRAEVLCAQAYAEMVKIQSGTGSGNVDTALRYANASVDAAENVRLLFRCLFVRAGVLEFLGKPFAALADSVRSIELLHRQDVRDPQEQGLKLLVASYDVPRLMREAYGPLGSDARVVLCNRTSPDTRDQLPELLSHAAYVNYNGCAYRFGGRGMWDSSKSAFGWEGVSADVWLFDCTGETKCWRLVECTGTAPAPRSEHSACLHGSKIWIYGGDLKSKAASRGKGDTAVYSLDLSQHPPVWTVHKAKNAKQIPRRKGHSAQVFEHSMFVFGGEAISGDEQYLSDTWRLDLATLKWSAVNTTDYRPAGRSHAAHWVYDSKMYIYGGQYLPTGSSSSLATRSCDNFDVLDLRAGTWDSLPLIGHSPGLLQETCVVVLRDGRVVIWGGYMELSGMAHPEILHERERANNGEAGDPADHTCYKRGVFVYEGGTWRMLRKLGHDAAAMAQGWAIPMGGCATSSESTDSFEIIGGYGLVSDTPMVKDTPLVKDAGHAPEALIATYSCKICSQKEKQADSSMRSENCWGASGSFMYMRRRYDGCRDPRTDIAESHAEVDATCRAAVDPGTELYHCWTVESPLNKEKFSMTSDTYFGPIAEHVQEQLEKADEEKGELGASDEQRRNDRAPWTPSKSAVFSHPKVPGPLFNPVAYVASHHRTDWTPEQHAKAVPPQAQAMARIVDDNERVLLPKAQAYAAQLKQWSQPKHVNFLTIRIELSEIVPCIFRQVRVAARMTLAELHDYVICPIFGYTRGYHAYAFRRGSDPWLGPVTSTAIDMAHIPFYIGAMGDDTKVKLGSLLLCKADTLEYVMDFGDWYAHTITCEAIHDVAPDGSDMMMTTAQVLDGAFSGPPVDVGGSRGFVGKLNKLLGCIDDPDTAIEVTVPRLLGNMRTERPLTPQDESWWDLLNDEFRRQKAKSGYARVEYNPLHFDLGQTNADLLAAVASGPRKPKDAHKLFVQFSHGDGPGRGNGLMMERDVNLVTRARSAKRSCAVCGSAAALKACSRCKEVHYCCKEHQLVHWKTHKHVCSQREPMPEIEAGRDQQHQPMKGKHQKKRREKGKGKRGRQTPKS